ncbi:MAG: hypothetical protein KME28_27520 [Pelatocladus maniniholoensis HA4357-MV3]|jgi:hypothetical protein|uniref:Uncharacterized protein n=1 Tax=Pelatocladus maniniholoensis HA4357-MV3 TaxID=1117104 RepID=A0A9E3LVN2_9NOST|nr:hypothetical protein [Pelatocladus maniniholoensis HA4357-MV3]
MVAKQERLRIDLWASVKPIVEAETNRTGLTAQEVVNIALIDYFGLSPKGKAKIIELDPKVQLTQETIEPVEDTEDYI